MSQTWTIRSVLQWTQSYFKEKTLDTPRLDAELLIGDALKVDYDFSTCPTAADDLTMVLNDNSRDQTHTIQISGTPAQRPMNRNAAGAPTQG